MDLTRRGFAVLGAALAGAATAVVGAAVLITLAPSSAHAQNDESWSVVSARMTAEVAAEDGSAHVRVRYVLSGTPRGARLPLERPARFELLGFGEATVSDFTVDGGQTVVLWPTSGRHRAAGVAIPSDVGDTEVVSVELAYRVEGAIERAGPTLRVRVPVLSGPTAPEPGADGEFHVRIRVPPEWRLSEGFPSGLRAVEPGIWAGTVRVVPALVGFRGRSDGAWRPDFPLMVDVVMLAILAVFTWLGWRHLRRISDRIDGPARGVERAT